MPKKNSKKPPPSTETIEETYIEQAEAVFRRLIATAKDGDITPSESVGVVRAAALLDSEKRKLAKEARKQLEGYSISSVVAWARTISPQERRALVNELTALDQKGSLLS